MHPIKAFVGHSFAGEDESAVTAILNILRRVAELHPSFVWEDAAHPEPKGVDSKVLQRFEGKNLFIAICTKKERIVANAALHAPRFQKDKLIGKASDFGWKTSDWIIQEIGVALGRGMNVILLLEEGTRPPGELQANLERIIFKRTEIANCSNDLMAMIAALTPRDAVIQTTAAEPSAGEDQVGGVPPAPVVDIEPNDMWTRANYEFALMGEIADQNKENEDKLYARFLASPEGTIPENKVGWEAWRELCRIRFAGGDMSKLLQLAKANPQNIDVANNLAAAYRQFSEFDAAAAEFKRAADLATADAKQRIRFLGEAAVASHKAGKSAQVQEYSDLMRAAYQQSGDAEREVLQAERKLAVANSSEKALVGLLERMLELNPGDSEARFALAYKYSEMDMYRLAAYHYSKIPAFGRSSVAWNNLGVALDRLGLSISSIAAYRRAEEKGETLAMANIAAKLVDAGFLPEAEKILNDALAVEDHHKNVDSGLASAKSAEESENVKETKIFDGAKSVSNFYRAFGRAFVKPLANDISGRWNIPNGHVDLVSEGREVTGVGAYEIQGGILANLMMGLGNALSGTPERWVVEYHATRFGAALVGTVSRRREGATPTAPSLLGGNESKPCDCLMWVSDSGGQITILEESGSASPNFHKLNRT
jgi:tetratricopeptide (TPR) repeat protein